MVFQDGETNKDEEEREQSPPYFQLDEGEKSVADSGYGGKPRNIDMPKDEHSAEFKEFLACAKNRRHFTDGLRLLTFLNNASAMERILSTR